MNTAQPPLSAFRPGRQLPAIDGDLHDPYQSREQPPDPAVCTSCGVSFHHGKWQWTNAPDDAARIQCPACRHLHDKRPAASVTIAGSFALQHRAEILNLIHNHETYEKVEHPMQRIMVIRQGDDRLLIDTTDAHLARGLCEALEHAYGGDLRFHFSQDEQLLRLHWER